MFMPMKASLVTKSDNVLETLMKVGSLDGLKHEFSGIHFLKELKFLID